MREWTREVKYLANESLLMNDPARFVRQDIRQVLPAVHRGILLAFGSALADHEHGFQAQGYVFTRFRIMKRAVRDHSMI